MDGHPRRVGMARASAGVVSLILVCVAATGATGPSVDPFAFFSPSVHLTNAERIRLGGGEVIARALPADDGHVAVFAATRITAAPRALLDWTRQIELLKQAPQVLGVGRFRSPPSTADLVSLSLEPAEVDELGRCRPGACDLKLSADEIETVHGAIARAGPAWRQAVQDTFRGLLVERVRRHHDAGLLALPPYADKAHGVSVGEAFSAIVARSPYLIRAFPDAVNTLQTPARGRESDDAFYYWSRERYGRGRTVITVTYVRLLEERAGVPQALTVSTQLFASHYVNGAVGVTAIVCSPADGCYLAYLNRTQTDILSGLFGGLKRNLLEGRVQSDAPAVLRVIKQRIESGAPGR